MKASKSRSAAITSKVSFPLRAALLAGITQNMACFSAIQFYGALMNWAVPIRSQEHTEQWFSFSWKVCLWRQVCWWACG